MTTQQARVLQGDLSEVFIPKLLYFISHAQKTGILYLESGEKKVQIHFHQGRPVFVSSNNLKGLELADFLKARGILAQEVLESENASARQQGKRLGVHLLEKGMVDAQSLFETINLQVKAKLFRSFSWVEGRYVFRESGEIDTENQNLSINLPNIIYEGIRDYVPMDKLPVEFRGRKDDAMFRRTPEDISIEDLRLKKTERRLLKLVDGKRTLRQLVILLAENKKQTYKSFYGLFILGFLAFTPGMPARTGAQPEKNRKAHTRPAKTSSRAYQLQDDESSETYSVQAPEDLIAEAMASVDRIKKEVKEEAERPSPLSVFDEQPPCVEVELESEEAEPEEPEEEIQPVEFGAVEPEPETEAVPEFSLEQKEPEADEQEPEFSMSLDEKDNGESPETVADEEPQPLSLDDGGQEETTGFQPMDLSDDIGMEQGIPTTPEPGFGDQSLDMGSEGLSLDDGGGLSMSDDPPSMVADTSDRDAIPESPDELVKQARYFIDAGDYESALPLLQNACELDPNLPDAKPLLGWVIYNDSGRSADAYREAEGLLKDLIKSQPDNWHAFFYLGKIYKAEKQRDFAELHFLRAFELNHECTEAKEEIKTLYS